MNNRNNLFNVNAKVLIIPGLGNSGPDHWQTRWQNNFGFTRVEQAQWDTPVCSDWVDNLNRQVLRADTDNIILVGHSLACATIAFWSARHKTKIKGALLVAPSDVEAPTYPEGTTGFIPMPLDRLHFPSIVVASTNDFYVSLARANFFASAWGSNVVNMGDAGHINAAAGYGNWDEGLTLLKKLDNLE